jgi:hypothetical protein
MKINLKNKDMKNRIKTNGVLMFMLIWNIINAAIVIKYSDFMAIMAVIMAMICTIAMWINEYNDNNDKPFKLW